MAGEATFTRGWGGRLGARGLGGSTMAEYIVAGLEITDPAQFQKYSEQVVATVRQYGGTYVIRGGQPEKLEGTWNPKRISILEFPSAEGAKAWYRSPEYSAIINFRQRGATTDLVLVQGVPRTRTTGRTGFFARFFTRSRSSRLPCLSSD